MNNSSLIDAVITWVDGHDEAHAQKLKQYLFTIGRSRPEAAAPTRFNAVGELEYCILSIVRFAPWIRTIYIVTDGQTPSILATFKGTVLEHKVKCVDHRDIFNGFDDLLPTFNIMSIEAMLWRIPGLSEQFIYFNDDNFLIRPLVVDDFFHKDQVRVRGRIKLQLHKKTLFRQTQEKSARWAGFKYRYLHLEHVPHALRKDFFETLFLQDPKKYIRNASFPLRDLQQVWPIAWAYHEALNAGAVILDKKLKAIMINPAHHLLKKIKARLATAIKNKQIKFLCVQSLDEADEETFACVISWLRQQIGQL